MKKINPKKILQAKREKKLTLVDSLSNELEREGVEFFKPVEIGGKLHIEKDYLTLPRDITKEESRELGRYLNALTQQRMYMRTLIGWQEISVEESKRKYYDKAHDVYLKLCEQKLSETAKERIINNTAGIKHVFIAYKDEKRKLGLLQYNLMSIEDAVFTVSREISRRESDWNLEKRNYNVQRR